MNQIRTTSLWCSSTNLPANAQTASQFTGSYHGLNIFQLSHLERIFLSYCVRSSSCFYRHFPCVWFLGKLSGL